MSEEPKTLLETARAGSRVETLRRLRDALATQLENCDSKRDYAALSQRFVDVLAQIETCEKATPEAKGTALDEVNARRAAKAAKGAPRTAGGRL